MDQHAEVSRTDIQSARVYDDEASAERRSRERVPSEFELRTALVAPEFTKAAATAVNAWLKFHRYLRCYQLLSLLQRGVAVAEAVLNLALEMPGEAIT